MKKTIFFLLAVLCLLGACRNGDIDDLQSRTDSLEVRVSALEDMQKDMWQNIQALQQIINDASFDYVTAVTPLADGSGYQIAFKKNAAITIKNGKQGEKGDAPDLSVKKDTDGEYYWTLNGEFLLAADGSKMPVRGEKGDTGPMGPAGITLADGTTSYMPMVQINKQTMMWEISVDGGKTWASTNVKASGGSIFADNGVDNSHKGYITLKLSDGTAISLPKYQGYKIGTDESNEPYKLAEKETTIGLTTPKSFASDDCVAIVAQLVTANGLETALGTRAAASSTAWKIAVQMPAFDGAGKMKEAPTVKVTLPEGVTDGEKALLRVTFVDGDGNETTVSRILTYTKETPQGEPVKVGYYYYSDGSYSESLNSQKTCIGVVFYVGDVAKDDESLRAKLGNTNKGYHGLVVALKDVSSTIWMSKYKDVGVSMDLNLMNGYANTQKMIAWNNNDANIGNQIDIVFKINAFATQYPAPKSSSGWYLPSIKELSTLCSGYSDNALKNDWKARGTTMRDQIQGRLEPLGNAASAFVTSGGTRFYWSSTGVKAASHMSVGFADGTVRDLVSNDATNPRSARLILAF